MTSFELTLRPGQSIFDQLVSAAKKAILSDELTEGQAFPSVRSLAANLKIHPNTAHKAVQYLIHERWLEIRPGIGTVVAPAPHKIGEMRRQLMQHKIAELIAGARRMGLSAEDLKRAVDEGWEKSVSAVEVNRDDRDP
jgi:DNA-binding transcriptional regulator YhcF (GntR family)